jgi:hypothetical protein
VNGFHAARAIQLPNLVAQLVGVIAREAIAVIVRCDSARDDRTRVLCCTGLCNKDGDAGEQQQRGHSHTFIFADTDGTLLA